MSVAENVHQRYVNKRLASVRQLLSTVNGGELSRSAAIDAASLQMYFAVFHYVNELLVAYHQPAVETNPWQLTLLIEQKSDSIPELNEWKQLLLSPTSFLSLVLNYPNKMLCSAFSGATDSVLNTEKVADNLHHIALVDVDIEEDAQLTDQNIHWALDACYELIQRQRSHLIEC